MWWRQAADLPRPPESGGSLKGGAVHDHGGCDFVDPGVWWQGASVVPGVRGIVELFAAELPRPPEAQWLVYLEGLGVDMQGYLDNLKRLQSGHGERKAGLRGDVGLGTAVLDDEGNTKMLAASNSTSFGGSRRSGRRAKSGKKSSRAKGQSAD